MEDGSFKNHPLMRLTLTLTLVLLGAFWLTNFLIYFSKMGLTPASVVAYYLGSDADFSAPRSYQSMVEVSHFHLPMIAIVVLLLTHLIIFAPFKDKTKVAIIITGFASGFLNEGASWLVRFVSPHFAVLKIFSFLAFQGVLALLLSSLGWYLWSMRKTKSHHKKSHA